jgi:hypothetical protein
LCRCDLQRRRRRGARQSATTRPKTMMTMTTHARVTTHAMVAARRYVSCAHVPGDNDALTATGTDGLRPTRAGLTFRIYSSSSHSLKTKRTQMTAKGDRVGVRVRASANASSEPVVISLKVDGMMCDGCAESVETCLKKVEGKFRHEDSQSERGLRQRRRRVDKASHACRSRPSGWI